MQLEPLSELSDSKKPQKHVLQNMLCTNTDALARKAHQVVCSTNTVSCLVRGWFGNARHVHLQVAFFFFFRRQQEEVTFTR